MRVLSCLAGTGAALCLLSSLAVAAPSTSPPPRPRPVADAPRQELVTFTSTDGLAVSGVFTWPSGPTVAAGPIILHLPDGPGSSPLRAADTSRYVAQGLARLGYPSLSIETRHGQQYAFGDFDDAFADVKAAIDMLVTRGFSNVILAGDGVGNLLAVRYAVESDDGRVKGVIAYAPSTDLAAAWRTKVGEEVYARTVENATKVMGEGSRSVFIDAGKGLVFTPPTFLNWYGPRAKTSLSASLARLDKPLLLAAGANDPDVPAARLQQLAKAAVTKKVTVKSYPGAGHEFGAARTALVSDTANWLADLGLTPATRVVTTTLDATARDGTPLVGVLYAPADQPSLAPNRPVFMVVHGWTGDVMRSTSHWLAARLAREGYTVLAIRTRASGFRGTVGGKLEDIPQDIAAWTDVLAARGARQVIGIGHSSGGLWLSTYLAQSHDKRFRGVVYLGPTRDFPAHARKALGDDTYNAVVHEAEDAVKRGEGATHLIDVPFPQPTYEEDPRQPMYLSAPVPGYTYFYADAFLSYWGPNSKAVHTARIAEVKLPILAIGGSRDPQMQGGWLLKFIDVAGGPAASIFYGGPTGAPASFEGYESKVTEDIVGWAEKLP